MYAVCVLPLPTVHTEAQHIFQNKQHGTNTASVRYASPTNNRMQEALENMEWWRHGYDHAAHLLYALKEGHSPSERTFTLAAGSGRVDCLRILYEHGSPRGEYEATEAAAAGGHIECLKFMHKCTPASEYGRLWDGKAPAAAATNGHLAILRFLHRKQCPWDVSATEGAARSGHLRCMRYLHKCGGKLTERAMAAAAYGGHLSCVRFMHRHKCPSGDSVTDSASRGHAWDCLSFLIQRGYPVGFMAEHRTLRDGNDECRASVQSIRDIRMADANVRHRGNE